MPARPSIPSSLRQRTAPGPFPRFSRVSCRMALVAALGAQSWCAAQEVVAPPPELRDTVTMQSGYFSGDYANNVDYVQVVLEQSRGIERLSRWAYQKNQDRWDGPLARSAFFLGATLSNFLGTSFIAFHEWGHASRLEAGGLQAQFFTCQSASCPGPRDFFGFAGSMYFKLGASTQAVNQGRPFLTHKESGRAAQGIVMAAGVNNDTLFAERAEERYFLAGQGGAVALFSPEDRFAIAEYVSWGSNGPGNDINNITQVYRSTGVDPTVTPADLRHINMLSALSGAFVSNWRARYAFIANGDMNTKPWLIRGFWVPNQYNYLSSHGITRKWVSGYAVSDSLRLLGSYESVVRGDDYSELGFGVYKDFGTWDVYAKVTGKDLDTLNLEAAASRAIGQDWRLGLKAYVWDTRSLLGERNTLDFSKNKTQQLSVALSYVY